MEKLKSFTFNNIQWQYREFRRSEISHLFLTYCYFGTNSQDFDPFGDVLDTTKTCQQNLCRMIRITETDMDAVEFQATQRHWIDAEGVAWPEHSLAVRPNPNPHKHPANDTIYVLVAPKLKVS